MLGASALLVGILAPGVAGDLAVALGRLLEHPHEIPFTVGDLDRVLASCSARSAARCCSWPSC